MRPQNDGHLAMDTLTTSLRGIGKALAACPGFCPVLQQVSPDKAAGDLVPWVGPCGAGRSPRPSMPGLHDHHRAGEHRLAGQPVCQVVGRGRAALRKGHVGLRFRQLALAVCLAGWATVWAADWPQWRGPARDGTSPETGWSHAWPGGEPRLAWKGEVGKGLSSVAVSGGAAYTLGNQGGTNVVWCLDASDGRVRWTYRYPEALMDWQFEGGPCSTPLVEEGRVYAVGRSSVVHCLDAATGKLVWQANLRTLTGLKPGNWGLNSSPLRVGARLILNFGTAGIALDPADGRQLWLTGPDENTYTSPIPGQWAGRDVLFVAASERLAVVDTADGQIRWSRPFHVSFKAGDPVRTPGGVFFPSVESGGVFVRLPKGGEPEVAWTQAGLGAITGTPVLVGRHLYGVLGSNNGKGALTCLEPETGKVSWSRSEIGRAHV